MTTHLDEARRAHRAGYADLLSRRNVVAVGVGYKTVAGQVTDELAIVCSVLAKRPRTALAADDLIPATVAGVTTDVVQTGPFFALQPRTGRWRPAPGGVSIGHVGITAGTLGCLVRKGGQLHILSNNHVLANSNDASVGDAILQPGAADGGRDPADRIARLSEWVPIRFEGENGDGDDGGNGDDGSPCAIAAAAAGLLNIAAELVDSRTRLRAVRPSMAPGTATPSASNQVDAAIAEPLDPADVDPEVLEIGPITGLDVAALGMAIKKSGRTTGLTTGAIAQIDVSVQVSYGPGRTAVFNDQLLAGAMSQGGDSGSAVLSADDRLVGLLFAGSTNSTVINRIQNVFQALDLALP